MVSVNLEAKKTVDVMIEKQDELNIAVSQLSNGATIIDCGVNVTFFDVVKLFAGNVEDIFRFYVFFIEEIVIDFKKYCAFSNASKSR